MFNLVYNFTDTESVEGRFGFYLLDKRLFYDGILEYAFSWFDIVGRGSKCIDYLTNHTPYTVCIAMIIGDRTNLRASTYEADPPQ